MASLTFLSQYLPTRCSVFNLVEVETHPQRLFLFSDNPLFYNLLFYNPISQGKVSGSQNFSIRDIFFCVNH